MSFCRLARLVVVVTLLLLLLQSESRGSWRLSFPQQTATLMMTTTTATAKSTSSTTEQAFQIVILSMNRFASLQRLVDSLLQADYKNDHIDLTFSFDRPTKKSSLEMEEWETTVRRFVEHTDWKHGRKTLRIAPHNRGLRDSWLQAWQPRNESERAIIFEDDVEVSPAWYLWLSGAHDAYYSSNHNNNKKKKRNELAGFSLQRQYLVPRKDRLSMDFHPTTDNGDPFLYALHGTIGFSPIASVWSDFLQFAHCAIESDMNVLMENLITTTWARRSGVNGIWGVYFSYYCDRRHLYAMYSFPSGKKALAAHWRERGEHSQRTEGRDFELASYSDVTLGKYPGNLVTLDWGAEPVPFVETNNDPVVCPA